MKAKVTQFFNSLTPSELRVLAIVMMVFTGLFNMLLTLAFSYGLIYALIAVFLSSGFQAGNIVGVMIILYVYRQLWVDGYLLESTIEKILDERSESERSMAHEPTKSGGLGEVGN